MFRAAKICCKITKGILPYIYDIFYIIFDQGRIWCVKTEDL